MRIKNNEKTYRRENVLNFKKQKKNVNDNINFRIITNLKLIFLYHCNKEGTYVLLFTWST